MPNKQKINKEEPFHYLESIPPTEKKNSDRRNLVVFAVARKNVERPDTNALHVKRSLLCA